MDARRQPRALPRSAEADQVSLRIEITGDTRMARLVWHDATGPIEIKQPNGESIWICACGLSQTLPYCDSSHENTAGEPAGKVCVYDKTRTKVVETRPLE